MGDQKDESKSESVIARTHWVWTEKGKELDPYSRAGNKVWSHINKSAPKRYLDEGYIQDSSEFIVVGQITLDL
ncbi:hypothetical protein [Paenibacillus macquariensis]|uniref:Uncharacterized protein n=1 Tax=Paenibacillus macquariensis TaxID=948756 RepID=A0ABY1JS64_9BACL|nr:hypothetical protein [Paenibacillus macquariensis]MEC0092866.1 hypothetical protein [Paenibacillus macquariensis]OAB36243.1 hypothetical protein PMSM_07280 [Paenibacillus macquariensis subsp. macquariensis]SIQ67811.1 hypothetical protein SAMN05421578_103321 [Paenibacillus macquariensis]